MTRKLSRGEQVKIAAADYNRWQEAGKADALMKLGMTPGLVLPDTAHEGIILVKNTLPRFLKRYSVLGLRGTIPDPLMSEQQSTDFQDRIALKGETPSSVTTGRFCVIQTDAEIGEVVPALVSGVTPVRLNIQSLTDEFADIETNDAFDKTRWLKSGNTGAAQILYAPAYLGEQWCDVRLSNRPAPASSLIHFELGGTLTLRESPDSVARHAIARILEWDGDSWEATGELIEVYDWFGTEGMWNGISGYRGWARKHVERPPSSDVDGGRQAYEIVWMERKAQRILFTTTEYMGQTTGGRVTVSVGKFDWQGKSPTGTIVCYDVIGCFADVPSGATGIAYYNNREERYEIWECERLVKFATATLNGAMCGSSATIDNFDGYEVGEFVKDPATLPTTAANPCGLAGLDNDTVLLRRIDNAVPNGGWEVVQVKHHVKTLIVDLQVTGFTFQKKEIEAYVQLCDNASPSWETWHTGDDC